eukprot:1194327-Ditylum_brightwellii.AAC.1
MAKDKLCNILYRMVKHKWCEALRKSSRTASDMTIIGLEEYFEQIELLDNIKQKGPDTIMVDDDSDDKKLSKQIKGKGEPSNKRSGKQNTHKKKSHFSGQPKHGNKLCVLCKQLGSAETTHNTKDCKHHKVIMEKCFKKSSKRMSVHELFASNQKLTKKLKKLQKKGKK